MAASRWPTYKELAQKREGKGYGVDIVKTCV